VLNGSARKKLRERVLAQFPGHDPFDSDKEWKVVKLTGPWREMGQASVFLAPHFHSQFFFFFPIFFLS
jgi:hypothetical protein